MAFLKTAIFTATVPGTVAGVVPWLLSHMWSLELGAARWVSIPLVAAGALTYLACAFGFALARGTPATFDPPKELVVSGPHRYVRNPMYVGLVAILVGEALLYQAGSILVYAAALGLGFHLFVVAYEEPNLRGRFGDSYAAYLQDVPRWIPRMRTYNRTHADDG